MPVTLKVASHEAREWDSWYSFQRKVSSTALLSSSCKSLSGGIGRVVQSSFSDDQLAKENIASCNNGFVHSAYAAYCDHQNLIIRPEDVWFAILTQIGFYINQNAEMLRSLFVAHEGQKHLDLDANALDFTYVAKSMTHLIAENVKDPALRDWVMPSFSTTTETDKVVGSILFMGAMQKYFSYGMTLTCGIPSVTLLGEVSDWEDILARIDQLDRLEYEAEMFAKMLRPILHNMIRSFKEPECPEVVEFWQTIVSHRPEGSGVRYISGWLTAFCFWNEHGLVNEPRRSVQSCENVRYPEIKIENVPSGVASVPIEVNDYGRTWEATMVAGSVGIAATSSSAASKVQAACEESAETDESPIQGPSEPDRIVYDTLQPVTGWWVFADKSS